MRNEVVKFEDLSERELELVVKALTKRKNICSMLIVPCYVLFFIAAAISNYVFYNSDLLFIAGIVFLICLAGTFSGITLLCYNTVCSIKSKGRRGGNQIVAWTITIIGWVIIPWLFVNKLVNTSIAERLCGLSNSLNE